MFSRTFFLSLLSVAAAHFVLEIPTSLGYDDANEATGPCDTFDPTSRGTVTNWEVAGDNILLLTTHPSVTWNINVALVSDVTNWVPLVEPFNQTAGVGYVCFSGIPGFAAWEGQPVVLQLVQHAPDGALYQCAAIQFVAGGPNSVPSSCADTPGVAVNTIIPAPAPTVSSSSSSSAPSSTVSSVSSSTPASSTPSGSSSSSSGPSSSSPGQSSATPSSVSSSKGVSSTSSASSGPSSSPTSSGKSSSSGESSATSSAPSSLPPSSTSSPSSSPSSHASSPVSSRPSTSSSSSASTHSHSVSSSATATATKTSPTTVQTAGANGLAVAPRVGAAMGGGLVALAAFAMF